MHSLRIANYLFALLSASCHNLFVLHHSILVSCPHFSSTLLHLNIHLQFYIFFYVIKYTLDVYIVALLRDTYKDLYILILSIFYEANSCAISFSYSNFRLLLVTPFISPFPSLPSSSFSFFFSSFEVMFPITVLCSLRDSERY